jgi:hypothetical protein
VDVQGALAVDGRRIIFRPTGGFALLRSYGVELVVSSSSMRWTFTTRDGRWGKRHDFGLGGMAVVSGDVDGTVLVASDDRKTIWTAFFSPFAGWEEPRIVARYFGTKYAGALLACIWRGVSFLGWVESDEAEREVVYGRSAPRQIGRPFCRLSRGTDVAWQREEAPISAAFSRLVQGLHQSGPSALCWVDRHRRLVDLSLRGSLGVDLGTTDGQLVVSNAGEALHVWRDGLQLFARQVTENGVGPAVKILDSDPMGELTSNGRGHAAVLWVDRPGPLPAGCLWWCRYERGSWNAPELLHMPDEDYIQPHDPKAAFLSDGRALLTWGETEIDRNRDRHGIEFVGIRSSGHLWVRELDGVVYPRWNIDVRSLAPGVGPDDNGFFFWGGSEGGFAPPSENGLYAWRVIDGKPAAAPELLALARPGHTIMDVHPVIDHRGAATVVVRETLGNNSHIFACRFD